jgi:cytidyltransferase-like protein
MNTAAKIISLEQLKQLRPSLHDVVLAGGVFDLLHIGHVNHLGDAKAAGRSLIVHIASDKRVKQKKGMHVPIQPDHERAGIIAALQSVDYVFIADVPHYDKSIIEALHPDKIFFNQEAYTPEIAQYLRELENCPEVLVSDRPKNHHTSVIIKKIRSIPETTN